MFEILNLLLKELFQIIESNNDSESDSISSNANILTRILKKF
jgi:hypothetical protein